MDETFEIAKRIAGIRDACGYSQEQMAKELNIDIETYREYESNGFYYEGPYYYPQAGLNILAGFKVRF